jgi:predicted secreted protein
MLSGALVLALALAACASSGGNPAGGHRSTVSVRQADQGRRISVTKNSTVVVRLNSTYWRLQPASGSGVLHLIGTNVHRDANGVPGSGRGTIVARYRAASAGQAVVSATRTVCGEAMACSPTQRSFRVTVVVRG